MVFRKSGALGSTVGSRSMARQGCRRPRPRLHGRGASVAAQDAACGGLAAGALPIVVGVLWRRPGARGSLGGVAVWVGRRRGRCAYQVYVALLSKPYGENTGPMPWI